MKTDVPDRCGVLIIFFSGESTGTDDGKIVYFKTSCVQVTDRK